MKKRDICNKQFSNQSNSRKHIKNIHKKIKFKCEICGKKFSQKDNLQRHKKAVHSRSSEFECPVCEKKFCRKKKPAGTLKCFL